MRIEHPDITVVIAKGYLGEEKEPKCPICKSTCSYVYISKFDNEIVGCEECLVQEYAEDYID